MSSSGRPHLRNAFLFALVIVAANGLAYFIYSNRSQDRDRQAATDTAQPVPPPPATDATPEEKDSIRALAQEQKRKGVTALRSSNYGQAIVAFEAAAKLDPKDPDLATLLEVTRKLQAGDKVATVSSRTEVVEPPPAPPPPVRNATRNRRDREKERVQRPPPPEVEKALLLVTTTPEKLLLEIDGRAADMTPARVEVDPGSVRVVIRRGDQVLLDRKVNAAAGAVVAIQEDFTTAVAAVETPPPPPPKTDRGIAQDEGLDLVELIDRDKSATARAPAPAATGQPRVVVYLPGRNGGALESSLRNNMAGVEVQVLARSGDLKDLLERRGADAVIASPSVLRDHGLTPAMRGVGTGADTKFVAASFQGEVARTRLSSMTLGVVDERGRKQTTLFVSDLIGSAKPKLRRVGKLEDLLPLLQFKMVDAVLVRESDFAALERRTEQKLYSSALGASTEAVAVAFVAGGRRQLIERAVLGLGAEAKQNLGVGRWAGP